MDVSLFVVKSLNECFLPQLGTREEKQILSLEKSATFLDECMAFVKKLLLSVVNILLTCSVVVVCLLFSVIKSKYDKRTRRGTQKLLFCLCRL